jgi:hypothetical protein
MEMGFGRKDETVLECPFCHKSKVRVYHKEGYMQAKTSRISGRSATKKYKIPDTYIILEDCSNCGARKRDIQASYDGTYIKPMTKEERIEMLRRRGLPLIIESKH